MARIRSVKPEFWTDEDLADLPRDARLLYIGLWNLSDEHRRLRGDPRYIKGQLFPYDDDLAPADIDALIDSLASAGKAHRYRVGGKQYLHLPNLGKHQRLEPEKVPSKLPSPADADTSEQPAHIRADKSAPDPDESAPYAEDHALLYVAGSMEHVAGSMDSCAADATDEITNEPLPGIDADAVPPPPSKQTWTAAEMDSLFDEFWAVYPKRKDPRRARAAFVTAVRGDPKKRRPPAEPHDIIIGAMTYATERHGQDPTFTKHPTTWLNAGGWLSEADPPGGEAAEVDQARRVEIDRAIHALQRSHPPCPHGSPGGEALHPTLGFALCALCRRGALPVDDPDRAVTTPEVAAAVTEYRAAALVARRRPNVPELLRVTGEAKQLIAVGAPPGAVAAVARGAGRHGMTLALAARTCTNTTDTRGEAA